MTVCLADNYEVVELILRIILGRKDITIHSIRTQEPMKNLQGRSAILDVHAIDNTKKEFDVEIQRSGTGADAKRARHNSSLLDAHILKPGDDTKDIPDSYVIFITENDVMKGNQPIYPVERYVTIKENKVLFGDGSHIIYVNGKYRGNDEIGKLMYDFSCTNPEDMRNEAAREAALDNAKETAKRMIKKGKMPLEEIADYIPSLSLDELKQLEAEVMQMA